MNPVHQRAWWGAVYGNDRDSMAWAASERLWNTAGLLSERSWQRGINKWNKRLYTRDKVALKNYIKAWWIHEVFMLICRIRHNGYNRHYISTTALLPTGCKSLSCFYSFAYDGVIGTLIKILREKVMISCELICSFTLHVIKRSTCGSSEKCGASC